MMLPIQLLALLRTIIRIYFENFIAFRALLHALLDSATIQALL